MLVSGFPGDGHLRKRILAKYPPAIPFPHPFLYQELLSSQKGLPEVNSLPNKIFGIRLLFVAAGVMAVAGYCLSPWRMKVGSREVFVPERRERNLPAIDHPVNATALVRLFPGGAIDEARQWQAVRKLSVREVKAAIEQLPKSESVWESSDIFCLRGMLFYRWGELEPVVANAKALALFLANPPAKGWSSSGFPHYRRAAITAWIKLGGTAEVWEAVKGEEEMWACTLSVPGEVADMIVASLSDRSDEAAFQEVLRLSDENCVIAETLCRARALEASRTPESRAAFLAAAAAHPKPYVRSCAYQFLFREWAQSDLEAAQSGAAVMEMTDEMRKEAETEIDNAARGKKHDPEEVTEGSNMTEAGSWQETKEHVFKRWEASPSVIVDYRLREETRDLIGGTPEADLEAWFRELRPDHDAEDELREMIERVLVQRGADRFVRSLANHPPIGIDDALKETMRLWIEHDPASVKAWLDKDDLPPAVIEDRDDYLEDALDALGRE